MALAYRRPMDLSGVAGLDPKTRRLLLFVVERLAEDIAAAERARVGFDVEVTARMTSEDHSAFVRRYGPEWVLTECAIKTTVVSWEIAQANTFAEVSQGTYPFNATRMLAFAWREHPEYDQAWGR